MGRRKKDNGGVLRALVMVTQFGVNMLVPIFLCSFFGVWLGGKTGVSWLMIPFFFVGAAAGGRNIYAMAKQFLSDGDKNGGNEKDDGDRKDDA